MSEELSETSVEEREPGVVPGKAETNDAPSSDQSTKSIDAVLGVRLDVRVVLGTSRMSINDLLKLSKGSVIELDRRVGEPVDVMINDRLVARGDLVRIQGDMLGVALREIVKDFIAEV